jgi:hypothetical protein
MQKPDRIRYYITKTESGEEPTVRSVRVALGATVHDADVDPLVNPVAEPTKPARGTPNQPARVKKMVKDAIRRRPSDP